VAEDMSATSVTQIARWGAAVVLFQVVCHVAPRTTQAACSHLITSNAARSLEWDHLDRLIVGETLSPVSDDRAKDLLQPIRLPINRPCSGPICSGQDSVPNSAASQAYGGFGQWADRTAALLDQAVVPGETALCEPTPHSLDSRPAIFHPPPL
jgi:hypothetical protein